jgi:hypothetical protein
MSATTSLTQTIAAPFRVRSAWRSLPCGTRLLGLVLLGMLIATGLKADEWPKKIVLHPAAAPQPRLKYQLLPTMYERRPGNAAVFYGRVKAEQTSFFSSEEIWKEIHEAMDAPLSRVGKLKHVRRNHEGAIFLNLERGGQCEDCDWQYPVAEDGFATRLPDAQEKREFARMLQADIRWRVAHCDFDGAIRSLRAGYAMALHTADAPFLVTGLVGAAMCGIMSHDALELIQQPGAPNLYWAFTYLPRPLFDIRQISEGEMGCLDAAFPQLTDSDHSIVDPAYWRRQLEEISEVYLDYLCSGDDERVKFKQELAMRLVRGYPVAKQALTERGWAQSEVEAMPAAQVILLLSAAIYAEYRDDVLTSMTLPYWEARPYLDRFEERLVRDRNAWESPLPLHEALPTMQPARAAFMRQDRQIALLRLLEALRLHGAKGDGLPEKLNAIEVPLPLDPMTGKSFEYQLRDDVALISGPPSFPRLPFQYEVRLATAKPE